MLLIQFSVLFSLITKGAAFSQQEARGVRSEVLKGFIQPWTCQETLHLVSPVLPWCSFLPLKCSSSSCSRRSGNLANKRMTEWYSGYWFVIFLLNLFLFCVSLPSQADLGSHLMYKPFLQSAFGASPPNRRLASLILSAEAFSVQYDVALSRNQSGPSLRLALKWLAFFDFVWTWFLTFVSSSKKLLVCIVCEKLFTSWKLNCLCLRILFFF